MVEKDVHTEHCCIIHGCKYGDENCTVETRLKPQSFACQDCDDDVEPVHLARIRDLEAENAHLREVLHSFRDFVIERATQWDVSRGPCNHHNPIWAEVAEAVSA